LITRSTDRPADPAHWAQLDHDSVELVRRARSYLDEIAPLLPAAERDRVLPVEIIPGLLDVGFVRGAIGVRDGGGRGLSLAMRAINGGRLNVSAGCTGIAQAALEAASAHAVSRSQFGKPLAGFQLVQQLIADIAVQTNASRQVYQSTARLLDNGADARVECSMSKYFCSEAANQVATRAVQVFGAAGLMEGNVAERLFRDAREATIPEGTSQMQVLQIGKALLGVSAVR
jgi:alkylation response protein AidB-like acyl-CoA dehydrogenase